MFLSSHPRMRGSIPGLLLILVFAFASSARAGDAWSRDDAAHLLRRAGFGGAPDEIDRLHALGKPAAVEYLLTGELDADHAGDPPFCPATLRDYNPIPIFPDGYKPAPNTRKAEIGELRAWWIDRMVRTHRPLEEKMVLFWHGILTSGFKEVGQAPFLAEQNDLFRKHALGNYRTLIAELIHDPAMLKYLNNDQNFKGKVNENLARELMELFTMGEGNGYSEKDISELARALTGATVSGGYQFHPNQHDEGEKTILGQTGKYKPDDVAKLIFDTEKPAKYLARRLWEFFASPDPNAQEIDAIAAALLKNKWELKPALRELFTSDAFYSPAARFALVKSPTELFVGAMRQLEIIPAQPMVNVGVRTMKMLGQELFQPPNVRGWPGGETWITSATLYVRYNLCSALVEGNLKPGAFEPKPAVAKPTTKPAAPAAKSSATQPGKNSPPATKPANGSGALEENIAFVLAPSTQPATQPAKSKEPTTKPALAKNPTTRPSSTRPAVALAPTTRPSAKPATKPSPAPEITSKLPARDPLPASMLKIFADIPNPTAAKIVDAAIDRFIQRPLAPPKRDALLGALGAEPIQLGEKDSDARVRKMLALLLNTPEYQLE